MKRTLILLAVIAGLLVTNSLSYRQWRKTEERASMLSDYAHEKEREAITYKDEFDQMWNKNHALEMSSRDKDIVIQDLGVKLSKAQKKRLTQTTSIDASIGATVKPDTVWMVAGDSLPPLECPPFAFSYTSPDSLNSIHFDGDSITVESLVPLRGIVYEGKRTKRFLFFRYGPRSVTSEFTSPNPWVRIKDHQIIIIKK